VWVALPFYADWRWLRHREDSPWYPTMRLFRQTKPGDWEGVFARLADALRQQLGRPVELPALPKLGNKLTRCRYGTMLYPPRDQFIGRSLEVYGEFSEGEVALFRRLIQPGDTVVDVGANVGAHTLPLAQLVGASGQVLAFEPQRWLYYCLCANVALNDLTNVLCHQAALGERRGSLVVPELDYAAGGNFGGLELANVNPGGWSYTVPLERIDDLGLSRCHFLKIDVEGMEQQVLAGAVETIRRFQPLLYVEDDRRDKSAELRAFLQSLGYQLFLHQPPLFNPDNFLGRRDNVFGNLVSLNLYGHPRGRPLAIDPREFSMQNVG
jgi:FkbM family methyltransferase